MPKSDRSKGAGSGVALSAGDANQDLQPIRFGTAESEAQVRGLLSKADTMRVRVRLADEQDVEGHLFGGGDKSLVLALQLSGDDDVEGHAISIHFPDAEQARRFRNELLAAGVLTATLAMGVGAGAALAPHQTGTAAAPASQATVFMDTSAQAREGGAVLQSSTLAIPVGSASDIAQKAQAAESVTGPALKSAVGSQSKGAAAVNPAPAADAARTEAGVTGSLAGSTSGTASNPAAAADAARTQAGITGSLAGSSTARETPAIPQASAAAPAAQQISDEIAAARASAQAGAATSASIPQGASALSAEDQINAEIAAARAAATPAADAQTQAREGGALSQASATAAPKIDYSGKPLPPESTSSSPTSPSTSSPGVDYSGKPLPPVDKG